MTRTPALAVLSLLVALAALAVAYGSERFGGVVPCALCLVERWPWWLAAGCALLALAVRRRVVLWLVVLCMAGSVAAAGVHVGVERGYWPSPAAGMRRPPPGRRHAGRAAWPPCRRGRPSRATTPPTWSPGLPVSMAAGNGLLAPGVLGLFLAISLPRPPALPGAPVRTEPRMTAQTLPGDPTPTQRPAPHDPCGPTRGSTGPRGSTKASWRCSAAAARAIRCGTCWRRRRCTGRRSPG